MRVSIGSLRQSSVLKKLSFLSRKSFFLRVAIRVRSNVKSQTTFASAIDVSIQFQSQSHLNEIAIAIATLGRSKAIESAIQAGWRLRLRSRVK